MKAIRNVNIVLPDKVISKGTLIFNENIEDIQAVNDLSGYQEVETIDGLGGYVTPGLIDIHIHGFFGRDTMEGTYGALNTISENIIKNGVTSFLPTTMTMSTDMIHKALANIRDSKKRGVKGAQILGANLEGPFINAKYKGAQFEKYIQEPNYELLENFLDVIKIVTIAPELKGSEGVIRKIINNGIIVSVGHSGATYEEVEKARQLGLSHSTHLFNAMTGLHHRNPGIVGAVFASDMTCEIIADFIHLNPAILKIITKVKDIKDIILITDSISAGGLSGGEYTLGGQEVIVKDGEARLKSGALSGSVLTMDKAIRNLINVTGLSINQIVNMATVNPARKLNLDYKLGRIKKGLQADLVLFDQKFEVRRVFIKGEEKF